MTLHVQPHAFVPLSLKDRFRSVLKRRCKHCLGAQWNHVQGSTAWFPARSLYNRHDPMEPNQLLAQSLYRARSSTSPDEPERGPRT